MLFILIPNGCIPSFVAYFTPEHTIFMALCAFVASGVDFDVGAYLKTSPFRPISVFHKGQMRVPPNPTPRPDSGFVVLISEEQGILSAQQVEQVLLFIYANQEELDGLSGVGADNLFMDFGIEIDGEMQQSQFLPPELIVALGRFKMGLLSSVVQLPKG